MADEVCSRVATINYQEVLVDPSSNQKGDGLRYYLKKDPVANTLLQNYQEKNRLSWVNAALGTISSTLILAGLIRSKSSSSDGISEQKALLLGGVGIFAINFIIAKTREHNNEELLLRSVEEYNKRNLPRIYFGPTLDRKKGVEATLLQEF